MPSLPFDPDYLLKVALAAAIVAGFAIAARLLLFFLRTAMQRATQLTRSNVDDIILKALRRPIFWAVTLVGLNVAHAQVDILAPEWDAALDRGLFVGFTLIIYIAVYRLLRDLLDWYIHEQAGRTTTLLDDLLLPFLRRLLLTILTVVVLGLLLQYFDIPVGSFVATLGVGSLAVALAAQAALGNVISGLLILLDRRYRIGDRIELVNEGLIGDVTDIGLHTTRVQTMDHRVVIIPNSTIANNIVINHAYPDPTTRLDLPVSIAYGSDLPRVQALLVEELSKVEGVLTERAPEIFVDTFGESGIGLEMRVWIRSCWERPRMTHLLQQAAYLALVREGIEIPTHQTTVWHRVEPEVLPTLRSLFSGGNGAQESKQPQATSKAE